MSLDLAWSDVKSNKFQLDSLQNTEANLDRDFVKAVLATHERSFFEQVLGVTDKPGILDLSDDKQLLLREFKSSSIDALSQASNKLRRFFGEEFTLEEQRLIMALEGDQYLSDDDRALAVQLTDEKKTLVNDRLEYLTEQTFDLWQNDELGGYDWSEGGRRHNNDRLSSMMNQILQLQIKYGADISDLASFGKVTIMGEDYISIEEGAWPGLEEGEDIRDVQKFLYGIFGDSGGAYNSGGFLGDVGENVALSQEAQRTVAILKTFSIIMGQTGTIEDRINNAINSISQDQNMIRDSHTTRAMMGIAGPTNWNSKYLYGSMGYNSELIGQLQGLMFKYQQMGVEFSPGLSTDLQLIGARNTAVMKEMQSAEYVLGTSWSILGKSQVGIDSYTSMQNEIRTLTDLRSEAHEHSNDENYLKSMARRIELSSKFVNQVGVAEEGFWEGVLDVRGWIDLGVTLGIGAVANKVSSTVAKQVAKQIAKRMMAKMTMKIGQKAAMKVAQKTATKAVQKALQKQSAAVIKRAIARGMSKKMAERIGQKTIQKISKSAIVKLEKEAFEQALIKTSGNFLTRRLAGTAGFAAENLVFTVGMQGWQGVKTGDLSALNPASGKFWTAYMHSVGMLGTMKIFGNIGKAVGGRTQAVEQSVVSAIERRGMNVLSKATQKTLTGARMTVGKAAGVAFEGAGFHTGAWAGAALTGDEYQFFNLENLGHSMVDAGMFKLGGKISHSLFAQLGYVSGKDLRSEKVATHEEISEFVKESYRTARFEALSAKEYMDKIQGLSKLTPEQVRAENLPAEVARMAEYVREASTIRQQRARINELKRRNPEAFNEVNRRVLDSAGGKEVREALETLDLMERMHGKESAEYAQMEAAYKGRLEQYETALNAAAKEIGRTNPEMAETARLIVEAQINIAKNAQSAAKVEALQNKIVSEKVMAELDGLVREMQSGELSMPKSALAGVEPATSPVGVKGMKKAVNNMRANHPRLAILQGAVGRLGRMVGMTAGQRAKLKDIVKTLSKGDRAVIKEVAEGRDVTSAVSGKQKAAIAELNRIMGEVTSGMKGKGKEQFEKAVREMMLLEHFANKYAERPGGEGAREAVEVAAREKATEMAREEGLTGEAFNKRVAEYTQLVKDSPGLTVKGVRERLGTSLAKEKVGVKEVAPKVEVEKPVVEVSVEKPVEVPTEAVEFVEVIAKYPKSVVEALGRQAKITNEGQVDTRQLTGRAKELAIEVNKLMRESLEFKNYKAPTKLQREILQEVLKGKGKLFQAGTGAGKSAFIIPMASKLMRLLTGKSSNELYTDRNALTEAMKETPTEFYAGEKVAIIVKDASARDKMKSDLGEKGFKNAEFITQAEWVKMSPKQRAEFGIRKLTQDVYFEFGKEIRLENEMTKENWQVDEIQTLRPGAEHLSSKGSVKVVKSESGKRDRRNLENILDQLQVSERHLQEAIDTGKLAEFNVRLEKLKSNVNEKGNTFKPEALEILVMEALKREVDAGRLKEKDISELMDKSGEAFSKELTEFIKGDKAPSAEARKVVNDVTYTLEKIAQRLAEPVEISFGAGAKGKDMLKLRENQKESGKQPKDPIEALALEGLGKVMLKAKYPEKYKDLTVNFEGVTVSGEGYQHKMATFYKMIARNGGTLSGYTATPKQVIDSLRKAFGIEAKYDAQIENAQVYGGERPGRVSVEIRETMDQLAEGFNNKKLSPEQREAVRTEAKELAKDFESLRTEVERFGLGELRSREQLGDKAFEIQNEAYAHMAKVADKAYDRAIGEGKSPAEAMREAREVLRGEVNQNIVIANNIPMSEVLEMFRAQYSKEGKLESNIMEISPEKGGIDRLYLEGTQGKVSYELTKAESNAIAKAQHEYQLTGKISAETLRLAKDVLVKKGLPAERISGILQTNTVKIFQKGMEVGTDRFTYVNEQMTVIADAMTTNTAIKQSVGRGRGQNGNELPPNTLYNDVKIVMVGKEGRDINTLDKLFEHAEIREVEAAHKNNLEAIESLIGSSVVDMLKDLQSREASSEVKSALEKAIREYVEVVGREPIIKSEAVSMETHLKNLFAKEARFLDKLLTSPEYAGLRENKQALDAVKELRGEGVVEFKFEYETGALENGKPAEARSLQEIAIELAKNFAKSDLAVEKTDSGRQPTEKVRVEAREQISEVSELKVNKELSVRLGLKALVMTDAQGRNWMYDTEAEEPGMLIEIPDDWLRADITPVPDMPTLPGDLTPEEAAEMVGRLPELSVDQELSDAIRGLAFTDTEGRKWMYDTEAKEPGMLIEIIGELLEGRRIGLPGEVAQALPELPEELAGLPGSFVSSVGVRRVSWDERRVAMQTRMPSGILVPTELLIETPATATILKEVSVAEVPVHEGLVKLGSMKGETIMVTKVLDIPTLSAYSVKVGGEKYVIRAEDGETVKLIILEETPIEYDTGITTRQFKALETHEPENIPGRMYQFIERHKMLESLVETGKLSEEVIQYYELQERLLKMRPIGKEVEGVGPPVAERVKEIEGVSEEVAVIPEVPVTDVVPTVTRPTEEISVRPEAPTRPEVVRPEVTKPAEEISVRPEAPAVPDVTVPVVVKPSEELAVVPEAPLVPDVTEPAKLPVLDKAKVIKLPEQSKQVGTIKAEFIGEEIEIPVYISPKGELLLRMDVKGIAGGIKITTLEGLQPTIFKPYEKAREYKLFSYGEQHFVFDGQKMSSIEIPGKRLSLAEDGTVRVLSSEGEFEYELGTYDLSTPKGAKDFAARALYESIRSTLIDVGRGDMSHNSFLNRLNPLRGEIDQFLDIVDYKDAEKRSRRSRKFKPITDLLELSNLIKKFRIEAIEGVDSWGDLAELYAQGTKTGKVGNILTKIGNLVRPVSTTKPHSNLDNALDFVGLQSEVKTSEGMISRPGIPSKELVWRSKMDKPGVPKPVPKQVVAKSPAAKTVVQEVIMIVEPDKLNAALEEYKKGEPKVPEIISDVEIPIEAMPKVEEAVPRPEELIPPELRDMELVPDGKGGFIIQPVVAKPFEKGKTYELPDGKTGEYVMNVLGKSVFKIGEDEYWVDGTVSGYAFLKTFIADNVEEAMPQLLKLGKGVRPAKVVAKRVLPEGFEKVEVVEVPTEAKPIPIREYTWQEKVESMEEFSQTEREYEERLIEHDVRTAEVEKLIEEMGTIEEASTVVREMLEMVEKGDSVVKVLEYYNELTPAEKLSLDLKNELTNVLDLGKRGDIKTARTNLKAHLESKLEDFALEEEMAEYSIEYTAGTREDPKTVMLEKEMNIISERQAEFDRLRNELAEKGVTLEEYNSYRLQAVEEITSIAELPGEKHLMLLFGRLKPQYTGGIEWVTMGVDKFVAREVKDGIRSQLSRDQAARAAMEWYRTASKAYDNMARLQAERNMLNERIDEYRARAQELAVELRTSHYEGREVDVIERDMVVEALAEFRARNKELWTEITLERREIGALRQEVLASQIVLGTYKDYVDRWLVESAETLHRVTEQYGRRSVEYGEALADFELTGRLAGLETETARLFEPLAEPKPVTETREQVAAEMSAEGLPVFMTEPFAPVVSKTSEYGVPVLKSPAPFRQTLQDWGLAGGPKEIVSWTAAVAVLGVVAGTKFVLPRIGRGIGKAVSAFRDWRANRRANRRAVQEQLKPKPLQGSLKELKENTGLRESEGIESGDLQIRSAMVLLEYAGLKSNLGLKLTPEYRVKLEERIRDLESRAELADASRKDLELSRDELNGLERLDMNIAKKYKSAIEELFGEIKTAEAEGGDWVSGPEARATEAINRLKELGLDVFYRPKIITKAGEVTSGDHVAVIKGPDGKLRVLTFDFQGKGPTGHVMKAAFEKLLSVDRSRLENIAEFETFLAELNNLMYFMMPGAKPVTVFEFNPITGGVRVRPDGRVELFKGSAASALGMWLNTEITIRARESVIIEEIPIAELGEVITYSDALNELPVIVRWKNEEGKDKTRAIDMGHIMETVITQTARRGIGSTSEFLAKVLLETRSVRGLLKKAVERARKADTLGEIAKKRALNEVEAAELADALKYKSALEGIISSLGMGRPENIPDLGEGTVYDKVNKLLREFDLESGVFADDVVAFGLNKKSAANAMDILSREATTERFIAEPGLREAIEKEIAVPSEVYGMVIPGGVQAIELLDKGARALWTGVKKLFGREKPKTSTVSKAVSDVEEQDRLYEQAVSLSNQWDEYVDKIVGFREVQNSRVDYKNNFEKLNDLEELRDSSELRREVVDLLGRRLLGLVVPRLDDERAIVKIYPTQVGNIDQLIQEIQGIIKTAGSQVTYEYLEQLEEALKIANLLKVIDDEQIVDVEAKDYLRRTKTYFGNIAKQVDNYYEALIGDYKLDIGEYAGIPADVEKLTGDKVSELVDEFARTGVITEELRNVGLNIAKKRGELSVERIKAKETLNEYDVSELIGEAKELKRTLAQNPLRTEPVEIGGETEGGVVVFENARKVTFHGDVHDTIEPMLDDMVHAGFIEEVLLVADLPPELITYYDGSWSYEGRLFKFNEQAEGNVFAMTGDYIVKGVADHAMVTLLRHIENQAKLNGAELVTIKGNNDNLPVMLTDLYKSVLAGQEEDVKRVETELLKMKYGPYIGNMLLSYGLIAGKDRYKYAVEHPPIQDLMTEENKEKWEQMAEDSRWLRARPLMAKIGDAMLLHTYTQQLAENGYVFANYIAPRLKTIKKRDKQYAEKAKLAVLEGIAQFGIEFKNNPTKMGYDFMSMPLEESEIGELSKVMELLGVKSLVVGHMTKIPGRVVRSHMGQGKYMYNVDVDLKPSETHYKAILSMDPVSGEVMAVNNAPENTEGKLAADKRVVNYGPRYKNKITDAARGLRSINQQLSVPMMRDVREIMVDVVAEDMRGKDYDLDSIRIKVKSRILDVLEKYPYLVNAERVADEFTEAGLNSLAKDAQGKIFLEKMQTTDIDLLDEVGQEELLADRMLDLMSSINEAYDKPYWELKPSEKIEILREIGRVTKDSKLRAAVDENWPQKEGQPSFIDYVQNNPDEFFKNKDIMLKFSRIVNARRAELAIQAGMKFPEQIIPEFEGFEKEEITPEEEAFFEELEGIEPMEVTVEDAIIMPPEVLEPFPVVREAPVVETKIIPRGATEWGTPGIPEVGKSFYVLRGATATKPTRIEIIIVDRIEGDTVYAKPVGEGEPTKFSIEKFQVRTALGRHGADYSQVLKKLYELPRDSPNYAIKLDNLAYELYSKGFAPKEKQVNLEGEKKAEFDSWFREFTDELLSDEKLFVMRNPAWIQIVTPFEEKGETVGSFHINIPSVEGRQRMLELYAKWVVDEGMTKTTGMKASAYEIPARHDTVVLYSYDNAANTKLLEFIDYVEKEMGANPEIKIDFKDEGPLFSKKVRDGVFFTSRQGIGEASYGMVVAAALADFVEKNPDLDLSQAIAAIEKHMRENRVETYDQSTRINVIKPAGIDAAEPALLGLDVEELFPGAERKPSLVRSGKTYVMEKPVVPEFEPISVEEEEVKFEPLSISVEKERVFTVEESERIRAEATRKTGETTEFVRAPAPLEVTLGKLGLTGGPKEIVSWTTALAVFVAVVAGTTVAVTAVKGVSWTWGKIKGLVRGKAGAVQPAVRFKGDRAFIRERMKLASEKQAKRLENLDRLFEFADQNKIKWKEGSKKKTLFDGPVVNKKGEITKPGEELLIMLRDGKLKLVRVATPKAKYGRKIKNYATTKHSLIDLATGKLIRLSEKQLRDAANRVVDSPEIRDYVIDQFMPKGSTFELKGVLYRVVGRAKGEHGLVYEPVHGSVRAEMLKKGTSRQTMTYEEFLKNKEKLVQEELEELIWDKEVPVEKAEEVIFEEEPAERTREVVEILDDVSIAPEGYQAITTLDGEPVFEKTTFDVLEDGRVVHTYRWKGEEYRTVEREGKFGVLDQVSRRVFDSLEQALRESEGSIPMEDMRVMDEPLSVSQETKDLTEVDDVFSEEQDAKTAMPDRVFESKPAGEVGS
jgi:hypothetical protein